ncbi:GIY-YIG nuclease family protein [Synechococcus elongatus]|uniref:GIY-YIG nuclease family protein n=1 Tax=Synechococcus elongatus TaxID=32046 RepID=UPI0030D4F933
MTTAFYEIEFNGYWRESKKSSIPDQTGIYCVYACTHNAQAGTVSLQELIYIGESENVRSRILDHEKKVIWKQYLSPGEQLCYSFGHVNSYIRKRCEAAMIFKHKPLANREYTNIFPFDQTKIKLCGKTALLDDFFTVYPD